MVEAAVQDRLDRMKAQRIDLLQARTFGTSLDRQGVAQLRTRSSIGRTTTILATSPRYTTSRICNTRARSRSSVSVTLILSERTKYAKNLAPVA